MTATINASTTAGVVTTADTSGILQLQTNGTAALTISASQVATFAQAPSLPAGSIPQAALAAGVAGNGPAFNAIRVGNQTVSASTYTKVTYTAENFDTNSCFASNTFTPNVAGYYFITAQVGLNSTGTCIIQLWKNGSSFRDGTAFNATNIYSINISELVYANGTTDYFEIYGNPGSGTQFSGGGPTPTFFSAFLARSA